MGTTSQDLKIRYIGDASQLTKTQAGIAKSAEGMAGKLASAGKKMVGAGKVMSLGLTAPIVAIGVASVRAAEDAQAKVAAVAATWKKDADAAALSFSGMQTFAESFGDAIGQDDEAVLALAGRIQNATDLTKLFGAGGAQAGLEQMTQTVLDMSAATGKSSTMIQKLLNSVVNDPAAAVGTLTKLGIVTKAQGEHLKDMAAAGKGAAVSQQLLALMSDKYAGTAKAAATPSERLHAVLDNLSETLGAVLLPIFEKVVGWISKLASFIQHLTPGMQKMVVIALGIVAALGPLLIILGKLAQAFSTIGGLFAEGGILAGVALWPIAVAAAVVIAAIIIIKNWDKIKGFLLKVWNVLKAAWQAVWVHIRGVVMPVLNFIKRGFQAWVKIIGVYIKVLIFIFKVAWAIISTAALLAWKLITAAIRTQVAIWKPIINAVKTVVVGIWHVIYAVAKAVWDKIGGVVRGVWGGIVATVKGGINIIIDALNGLIGGLNSAIRGFNHLPGADIPEIPNIPRLARGGYARGLAIVGENGPELASFRGGGARVYSNADSRRMLAGGGGGVCVYVTVQGSVWTERELAGAIRRQLLETKRRNGSELGLA